MGRWRIARGRLSCALLAAIGVFGVATGAALYRFALPRPRLVEAGPVSAFPPAGDPYLLRREVALFIVNDGEELFALDPMNREYGPIGCRVHWNSQERRFIDPCRGDQFDLYGRPTRIAVTDLNRYPLKIEGDFVYVKMP
jgi:hypothetical protein